MSWMQTYTGKAAVPLDLRPGEHCSSQICVTDIAHSLSLVCRFNGHCRFHYSAAQHSVLVADHLPLKLKLAGLLHDAAEAYLGDIIRPLKRHIYLDLVDARGLIPFADQEEKVLRRIFQVLEVAWPDAAGWQRIKEQDDRAVMTEGRDIMAEPPMPWDVKARPYREVVPRWYPEDAEKVFLALYDGLKGE